MAPRVPHFLSVWRNFAGVACVCSFHAPQVAVAGDANVWDPHFTLGRSRSVDNMIIPFTDLFPSSCSLVLCNPHNRATHKALDLDCAPSISPVTVRELAQSRTCLSLPLGVRPLSVSVPPDFLAQRCLIIPSGILFSTIDVQHCCARLSSCLFGLMENIHQSSSQRPVQEVDPILNLLDSEMVSILAAHVLAQSRTRRQLQPSCWNAACLAACVARDGASTVRTTHGLPHRHFDEPCSATSIPVKLSVCGG